MRHLLLATILAVPASAQFSPALGAQTVGGAFDLKYRVDGQPLERAGSAVCGAGDVDGDGFDDFAVGNPFGDPFGNSSGLVTLFSGATGQPIARLKGQAAGGRFGTSVANAEDVNGDQVPDLLVGASHESPNGLHRAGSAFVFSGATRALLFRFDGPEENDLLGSAVSGVGDIDGDGVPDFLIGSPSPGPHGDQITGSAFLFSGRTGNLLFRFKAPVKLGLLDFGTSVSCAGDLDKDGVPDLAVGAPRTGSFEFAAGSVSVFSGATTNLLFRFSGSLENQGVGRSVANAGDMDGDGFSDLLVGAPGPGVSGTGRVRHGTVFLFTDASGQAIRRFDGPDESDAFGYAIAGPGDVDADGTPDILAGAPDAHPDGLNGPAGAAFVLSGASGRLIQRFDGKGPIGERLGTSVAGAGDVDRDGRPDLILGGPFSSPENEMGVRLIFAGSAFVYTFNRLLVASTQLVSVASGGTVEYGIDFPDELSGTTYRILVSWHGTGPTTLPGGLVVPLAMDGTFRKSMEGLVDHTQHFTGILGPRGRATATCRVGPNELPAKLIGRTIHLAVVDKGRTFSSASCKLTFQP